MSQVINLQKVVSVKGSSGLFHLNNYNPKGYFLQPFEGGSIRFFSNEKGKVLAIGNVDLKTKEGSINLLDVFRHLRENDVPDLQSDECILKDYFYNIVPDLDESVASSHIVKVLKWYFQISREFGPKVIVNEEDDGLTIA